MQIKSSDIYRNDGVQSTAASLADPLMQADELCNLQNQHEAEMASLTKCRQLICRSHLALGRKRQASVLDRHENSLATPTDTLQQAVQV